MLLISFLNTFSLLDRQILILLWLQNPHESPLGDLQHVLISKSEKSNKKSIPVISKVLYYMLNSVMSLTSYIISADTSIQNVSFIDLFLKWC